MWNHKKEKDGIEALLKSNREPLPDAAQKSRAISQAVLAFAEQPVHRPVPVHQKLLYQAQYISPMTYVMQLAVFVAVLWLFGRGEKMQQVHLIVASTAAPLLGMIGFTEIVRSFHYQMWELEHSCRYNLRYVMTMKLVVIGLLDLILFGGLLVFGVSQGSSLVLLAVYLLVPFHLSNMVYLLMLMQTGGRCPIQLLLAAGLAMMLLAFYFGERMISAGMEGELLLRRISAAGILALTFFGMLGMIVVFLSTNSWEEKKVWN